MIRQCTDADFEAVFEVINDGAEAYRGVIPADRWKEPYMPRKELSEQLDEGVVFHGIEEFGELFFVPWEVVDACWMKWDSWESVVL